MSKKSNKVDLSFIKQVDSTAEWSNIVLKNMDQLLVVEVYASVWGPSEMLDAHLSAICYDLADTLSFAFVRAVSDNIPSLKEYAGASSSVFLFYMQGKVVAKVVGPKMSEIKAKIFELAPKL